MDEDVMVPTGDTPVDLGNNNGDESVVDNKDNDTGDSVSSAKVVVYSTPTCHHCNTAKEFFKENNIEYVSHNVAEDMDKRAEMIELSGQMGVPVLVINGEMEIGFNEARIRDLLEL